jgi:cell division protease FtsH
MPDNDRNSGRRPGLDGPGGPNIPRPRMTPWIAIVVVVLGLLLFSGWFNSASRDQVSWTEYRSFVDSGQIVGTVTLSDTSISGTYRNGQGNEVPFTATVTSTFQPNDELTYLQSKGVDVEMAGQSVWLGLIGSILVPILLIGLLYWFLFRRMGAGGAGNPLTMGKNKVKIYDRKEMKTTFSDVAGVDEAKEELREVVDFLKNPKKYQRLGGRIPKGVLLLGPPGCGKTLLARAVAGEANVPFFFMSASEFVEMFVGLGAARVRELFEEAKRNAPAILFIDEIDAVGRMRGAGLGGGHDEREQTLNQLLSEMDGFDRDTRVIVLAATNRPDVLDPALLRPGRFDRRVVVELPEAGARRAILAVHTTDKPLAPDVDLERLAESTVGFSGADLANLANEAALSATRRRADQIAREDFSAAYDKIVLGDPREGKLREVEKRRVAVHEAGHALTAWVTPEAEPTRRVSILPRGMALGATHQAPAEDRHLHTRAELVARLVVLLGGYASERAVLGDISTGAAHDLREATRIASQMVSHYGMSEELGAVYYEHQEEQVFLGQRVASDGGTSDATVYAIETEVRALLRQVLARTAAVIDAERGKLDILVGALLERETLEREDLEALLGRPATVPDALPVTAPIPPSSVAPSR